MLKLPVDSEVLRRARELELPFNGAGIDPFGISRDQVASTLSVLKFFYRHYFKVLVHQISHVPAKGRCMLVGNHSGGYAIDGAMVLASMFFEMSPPRLAQGMAEKFINKSPFVSIWANRSGQFTGLPEHASRLLEAERLLLVFPEGSKGTEKLFRDRYSLLNFGTGFMRLALKTQSPIVPFAFLGGGEAVPTISNARGLGKLLGVPYIPITPYGLPLPLPVQLDLYYGAPMHFEGNGNEDDSVIAGYVDQVKTAIATMLENGRRVRKGES
jgi:1-acyl-sn-glycerol-3-phosphate acyltransferase